MFKKLSGIVLSCCMITGCSYYDRLESSSPISSTSVVPSEELPTEQVVLDSNLPVDMYPILPNRGDQTKCPYLDTTWVADTNGQKVLGSGIDTRYDTPACTFWSYASEPQLQVIVRNFPTTELAQKAVDAFAPIDSTSPASGPAGWEGGRGGWDNRSVYAVFKGTHAVIAVSNQGQSVKPEAIVEKTIENLGL